MSQDPSLISSISSDLEVRLYWIDNEWYWINYIKLIPGYCFGGSEDEFKKINIDFNPDWNQVLLKNPFIFQAKKKSLLSYTNSCFKDFKKGLLCQVKAIWVIQGINDAGLCFCFLNVRENFLVFCFTYQKNFVSFLWHKEFLMMSATGELFIFVLSA